MTCVDLAEHGWQTTPELINLSLFSSASKMPRYCSSESDDESVVVETTEKVEGPLAPQGSICETYNLYRSKPDEEGRTVWTDKIPENLAQPSENSVSNQYAIVVRRVKSYDSNKTLNIHSISIQSKALKDVLAKVFKGYSGITMSLDKVEFQRPFKPFVHRWDQLSQARDEEQDPALKSLIELLHTTLFEELSDTFSRKKDLIANGVVTHDLLWTLFEPGDVIFETVEEYPRAFIFRGYHEDRCGNFIISAGYIDFNGKKFGESGHSSQIPPFEGTAPITALPVLPLSYHPDEANIRDLLISRGRIWEKYRGYHYKHYEGIAEGNFLGRPIKFNVNSRVVIDTAGYNKFTPNGSVSTGGTHYDKLEDAQRLLTTPMLRGYVLKDKKWLDFYLDGVRDIAWNENAFESLVLPHAQQNLKNMILSFAEAQSDNLDTFDDVIQGKGKGVIMLLSGPPGVGKTLTAESVAEVMKVPLYMLSAGDLGTSARRVEQTLRDVLEMVPRWGAVLLLDEADVFMEERNSTDLERNELVSIFLRLLEYYEGILFLTSNRADHIDPAFESRIHVSIRYPELNIASRHQIWKQFLGENGISEFNADELEQMAAVDLNGRQIKNVIRTAHLLAKSERTPLAFKHVQTILTLREPQAD